MKTNFKFFFHLLIITGFISTMAYGFRQRMVEEHITFFSFALLAITVVCITGMMRNLVSVSPAEIPSKRRLPSWIK
ncbi:MAG: hypothetical protein OEV74_19925 [Cyclobacteriaceae bacterium]|nr:hypothetical protein [Cyclobacteriaceae bacterium]MDH4298551.1 hypothetical protein [Cyclobacteriaceae bacterium]MDH5251611.1 hypothetical protein [Cyclobacteriaceae bacterium]